MLIFLKVKLNTLVFHAKELRRRERHTLANARALSGRFSKKHRKGEEKPTMPPKVEKALAVENAADKSQLAYELYWNLSHIRKNKVRKEARDTNLAIGFLRGYDYERMEEFAHTEPRWDNIEKIIFNHIETSDHQEIVDIKQKFEQWTQEAKKLFGHEVL